ncbi:MAG: cysteine peptidase family C39 domain-containing protein, partial [bacterium]|nr:cysteine peptidase family C39 domain-containing protein [bacterium]
MSMKVPYHKQSETFTCAPASLKMVFEYFGRHISEQELADELKTDKKNGTRNNKIIKTAVEHGFFCYANNDSEIGEIESFLKKGLPVIVNYIEPSNDEGHYAVVVGLSDDYLFLNDPWNGKKFEISREEFLKRWKDSDGT